MQTSRVVQVSQYNDALRFTTSHHAGHLSGSRRRQEVGKHASHLSNTLASTAEACERPREAPQPRRTSQCSLSLLRAHVKSAAMYISNTNKNLNAHRFPTWRLLSMIKWVLTSFRCSEAQYTTCGDTPSSRSQVRERGGASAIRWVASIRSSVGCQFIPISSQTVTRSPYPSFVSIFVDRRSIFKLFRIFRISNPSQLPSK